MGLKRFSIILFCVIFLTNKLFSNPILLSSDSVYLRVLPKISRHQSFQVPIKIKTNEIFNQLKEIENKMYLNEQLKASDNPPIIYPGLAGIDLDAFQKDSLTAYEQLIFLYRNLCDRKAEASAMHSYGIYTALNGDMNESLTIFNEALSINNSLKNNQGIIKNYQSMFRIHAYMGNYFNAVKLGNTLVDISIKNQNNVSLAETYLLLAQIFTSQNDFQSAENMILNKALPLFYYKLNDKISAIKCYNQLAFIYQSQRRFAEAKWFYVQSNILARKIDHPTSIVNSLIKLASVKMAIGDWQLALSDFKEAEEISEKNQYKMQLIEINKYLNELYTRIGNTNEANLALTQFTELHKDLLPSLKN